MTPTATTPLHPDVLARIERITKAVADEFGILVESLYDPQRGTAYVSRARYLAMAVIRESTHLTLTEIGEHFGGRNYATVMFGCRIIADLKDKTPERQAHWKLLTSL